jgi:hypothetical protein
MTDRTRQKIAKRAVAALLLAFIVYCGGYFALGKREEGSGPFIVYTAIHFQSFNVAMIYLPLAMIESTTRSRAIFLVGRSATQDIIWGCSPTRLPITETYPSGTFRTPKS